MTARQSFHLWLALVVLAISMLAAPSAFAACSSPAGNAGDISYSASQNIMAYCNGSSWISMGTSSTTTFGTLTSGDFCTAANSGTIQCTTGAISLTSQVSGILPVGNGGTGLGSLTAHGVLIGEATSNVAVTAAGTAGQLLIGQGSTSDPTFNSMSGDCTITNAGSITCTKTGGVAFGSLATLSAAPAGTLTGSTLASNVTGSSLTSVGTITSGVWAGTTIGIGAGGTNAGSQTTNGVNYYNGTSITSGSGLVWNGTQLGVGTATPTATLTLNGSYASQYGTNYTTTGTQNDVAISSGNGSVRYTGSGVATFNGIVAGVNGQVLHLHNGSSNILTLANQASADTTVANQIVTGTGSNLNVAANSAVILQYDSSATNSGGATGAWRVIGGSGGSSLTGGTANEVPLWTSTTTIGTSNIYQANGGTAIGVGTATPNSSALLDAYSTTLGFLPPRVTTTQMNAISSPAAGLTVYNSTNNVIDYYNGSSWNQMGSGGGASAGGGQLIGVYSSSTAVSNNSIVFTGASNSSPSLSGTTLTLPSNASYIVVELWGAGGGGAGGAGYLSNDGGGGGGAGGYASKLINNPSGTYYYTIGTAGSAGSISKNGTNGNQSCFGTNSTACTSSIVTANGGSTGIASGGQGGSGGSASGGDINLSGGGGGGSYGNSTAAGCGTGGNGGSAPLGGGGGGSGSFFGSGYTPASGGVFGGGGGGGGGCNGANAGSAGGAGGIKISVYASGVTSGTIGTGSNGSVAYYNGTGTSLLGTTDIMISGSNVGIGTATPQGILDVRDSSQRELVLANSTNGNYSFLNALSGTYISGNAYWDPAAGWNRFSTSSPAAMLNVGNNNDGSIRFNNVGSGTNPISFNEVMRITSNGNVGIGTSAPVWMLDVGSSLTQGSVRVSGPTNGYCSIDGSSTGNPYIEFDQSAAQKAMIQYVNSTSTLNFVNNSNTGIAINSNGNVGIGATNPTYPLYVGSQTTVTFSNYGYLNNSGSSGDWSGSNGGAGYSAYFAGRINVGAEVDVTSDRRKKQDIAAIDSRIAEDFITRVRPVQFHWHHHPKDKPTFGFIAQDISKSGFDNLVGIVLDDKLHRTVDADGFVSPEGAALDLNYNGIIPLLTKAVQDFKVRFDSDHDALEKLKADNDNLRADLKAANDNLAADTKAIYELRREVGKLQRKASAH